MIGLIVLSVLLAYFFTVGIFIWLAIKAKEKIGRRIAKYIALALVLIPTWDIPIDGYLFHRLCQKEGGIFVYQKVGLSKNYYLATGNLTEKIFYYADGSSGRRKVEATGNELKIEMLKSRYKFKDSTDYDYVSWGKVVKFTTTVSHGEKLLGKAVSFIGGAGWLAETISLGPRLPGKRCPAYPLETDRPSYREKLLYEIFYKLKD
jgi:hypothetical protein